MRKTGVLAVAGALFVATAGAQERPTFRSSIDLVTISVLVRDSHHRLVTTLGARDFQVLDNGIRSRIVDFQRVQNGPVTLALLVDVSGSMRIGPKLEFARQLLDRLALELVDGRDEAGLFTFDAALHEQQPFTVHPRTIGSTFDRVEPFGTTSLYDAIAATARLLANRPPQRRAIIVFTDGVDTSSAFTPAQVSALASSIDVPVYIVLTVPPIDQGPLMTQLSDSAATATDLRDLAQWTGGDVLFASTPVQASWNAHVILSELRHQYLLAIESADRAEWRPLQVLVRDKRLTVRSRSGYIARDMPVSK